MNSQDQDQIFISTAITKRHQNSPKNQHTSQDVLQEGLKPGGLAHAQSY